MKTLWHCAALTLALTLAGCGGGGGGNSPDAGSQTATPPTPAPDTSTSTGNLKILFGDGPVDDFDQALLAVREIRLLGGDADQEPITVSADPATIDLLQLRNVSELVVDTEVPAGTYSKIRLLVESLELVRLDDQGMELERIPVRLPGNGKVDLNPQRDFDIIAGNDLVVQVDVDLDRAVHVVRTGNGQYRFRPVVFVDILDGETVGRFTRLFGVMDMIDGAAGTLELCDTEIVASDDDVPSDDCKPIRLTEDALVLDADGNIAPLDTLTGTATVLARFRFGVEAEDNYYQAVLLAAGDEDAFERRFGTVTESAADGSFGFLDDTADAAAPVRLLDEDASDGSVDAVVIGTDNRRTGADAIVAGLDAEIWGRTREIGEGADATTIFEAFLVHLRENPDAMLTVTGQVTTIDLAQDRLTVATDAGPRCVQLTGDTRFLRVDDSSDELAEVESLELDDLREDFTVEATGTATNDDGCLIADAVIVQS